MELGAAAVRLSEVAGQARGALFEGVLAVVDAPSDEAPAGACCHRVTLTREAAEEALPSLLGMEVGYRPDWGGHDEQRKIGLLTKAEIAGQLLVVSGYLYARYCLEVSKAIEAQGPEAMGMSYELIEAHVEDMREEIWKLTRVTFTGATILLRGKAAYKATSFCVAS